MPIKKEKLFHTQKLQSSTTQGMQGDLDTAFAAAQALPLLSGDQADHELVPDTDMEVRGG